MKKNQLFFISIVIAIFVLSCSANDKEINSSQLQKRADGLYYAINEEEPFSGRVVDLYKSNQKKQLRVFEDGLLNGLTTEWYSDGQKKSEIEYNNGLKEGTAVEWLQTGQTIYFIEYSKGNKNGIAKEWYPSGQQKLEEKYEEDKKNGSYTEWYENGQLRVTNYFKNDLPNGKVTSWYDNGQKNSEGSLIDGKRDGQWYFWYDNGQKMEESNYKNDKLEGSLNTWYQNGNNKFEGNYINNQQDGKCTFWFEDGQMSAEGEYRNGLRNGLCTFWYENGQIKRIAKYNNDKIVSDLKLWKDNGEEIGVGKVTDVDGNTYLTVNIGKQWWMLENLKVTHFRNMDSIPNVTDEKNWGKPIWVNKDGNNKKIEIAYCAYENDSQNKDMYGLLYNFYVATDKRGIAPEGWHVPSESDWNQLIEYLDNDAGNKLKEAGTRHWKSQNNNATNITGFTALPGGKRESQVGNFNKKHSFSSIGEKAYFWVLGERKKGMIYYNMPIEELTEILVLDSSGDTKFYGSGINYYDGYSIRCVKD